ncbi:MAG: argininosuccinate lyase [Ignavibacteria bacterium CG_4_8_14_3_um_filter_37_9]|nr:MAG: argininosuccinate lyase [Ignavibacteria bacterium CG_4_8_14_3_um_filter_37_9]PIX93866.1 MAG: argininosuccinate lyase [Ignavibacteria bacterium CG_4_10_14_3_um_filter_37_18]PJC60272.1 MAG: argininosuccinate lyase [Ignavibacteria bacterium CG_4_9_14_0_2_um_filter_37_13]
MLWGGRFSKSLNQKALEFSSSLSFDVTLIEEDIEVSVAHSAMLAEIGILTKEEARQIHSGLEIIRNEFLNESWKLDQAQFEDIHSAIESHLKELIGETADKLHTGRSRNDQVAADLRLWVKKNADQLKNTITELQQQLLKTAEEHSETIIPGYTHLQRAQPISFAFHLLAYVEMLERDKQRMQFVLNEADVSPLGCGALAGSTLPLDRNFTAQKLGFAKNSANALDAISDRDFVLDFLNACSIGMMHLSRLSEEIILWTSQEWKFVRLSDDVTTGSSLMPQKKNSDLAELIRGKSGRVFGNAFGFLSTMKSLPLSYNRDFQEDKKPLFDSVHTYFTSLEVMRLMFIGMEVNSERFTEELNGDFSLATDLADWLVLKGVPFRQAHHLVGEVVKLAETKKCKLNQLTLDELKKISTLFDESALQLFDISSALSRKKTFGSPNPEMVREQILFWETKLPQ